MERATHEFTVLLLEVPIRTLRLTELEANLVYIKPECHWGIPGDYFTPVNDHGQ